MQQLDIKSDSTAGHCVSNPNEFYTISESSFREYESFLDVIYLRMG